MKQYDIQDIRNIALVGHGASGKTSLAEAILYNAKVSDRLGKVGENTSVMDYDDDEISRGHTISASLAFYEWEGKKVNLVDTSGNNNFIADTPATLRVVDGSVIVVGAEDGVQFYTEKTWQWGQDSGVSSIVFINKMDHERADLESIKEGIRRKFRKNPVVLYVPVETGPSFSSIADVVHGKMFAYEKGTNGIGKVMDLPAEVKDDVETARAELIENVAEGDDALLETYLDKGELTDEEFVEGLKSGISKGTLIPVLCGSATHNIGVDLLMQAMIDYLPSPGQRPPVAGKDKGNHEVACKADLKGPLAALVFKTIADPYAGRLTLFRVFSGSLKGDSSITNSTQNTGERVGQLYFQQGKKQVPVPEISAGDLGTVAKLKVTTTGDTLSDGNSMIIFPPIEFPPTVYSRALVPKTRADEEKISTALKRLAEEDPTLQIERSARTHELILSGLGQVHIDVALEKMHRRFGVDVEVKPPKVPYMETIRGSTKVQGKYKKQTGGRGQYGDTWIEIAPMPKGAGFEFENKIVGGAIPKQYIPAVEKGIHEAMEEGVLAHYPMTDIRISLYDGSYHNVDSSEMAFKIAGSLGFKKGVMDCKPILLEPIMTMEIIVPSEYVGDVMGDLNSKRGKILGIDADDDNQKIRAQVPMAEVLNYAADLRSMTAGRGVFSLKFDHYDDVPEHLMQRIVEEARAEHEKAHHGH
ncbi:MAG: elongation factor G [Nitrospinae bacterium CG11_big_fil_rev_8_21_14_0_20_56_8]|nr:MAG: elongation factor G [Nitrospinae bacterium CG11_big_fil_rev_8_21_14_0_20_56_8]